MNTFLTHWAAWFTFIAIHGIIRDAKTGKFNVIFIQSLFYGGLFAIPTVIGHVSVMKVLQP